MITMRDRWEATSVALCEREKELAQTRRERDEALADIARIGRENNEMCDRIFDLERQLADVRGDLADALGTEAAA